MSIPVLIQVFDEVRRLAIAGSSLAPGDFRLKKLIAPLQKSGAKAPVFAKIAQSIQSVIDSNEKQSSQALLELSTLVNAVLYTQGETGATGRAKALPTVELEMPSTGTSARVLKPLIEALTSTGSGRFEIVRDAFERKAFQDIRLVTPALGALDDSYPELADFVAHQVLPTFGGTIYPELKKAFQPKGKGADVRRLVLMHQLDPEATAETVKDALQNGSKDVKVAAITCLNHSKEGLPLLLEQAAARSKEVRAAAYQSMALFDDAQVFETLKKAIQGKDVGIAVAPASTNSSPEMLPFLLQEAASRRDKILGTPIKTRGKGCLGNFRTLLAAFIQRSDKESVGLLMELFQQRDEFAKAKDASCDGEDFNRTVGILIVASDSKPALKQLVSQYDVLDSSLLPCAFAAAVKTLPPKKVFDMFSPYLLAPKPAKKKRNDPVEAKREVIQTVVEAAAGNRGYQSGYQNRHHFLIEEVDITDVIAKSTLHPSWLDVALDLNDRDLVMLLARPKHTATMTYLTAEVERLLKRKDVKWELGEVLSTMSKIQHPEVVSLYLKAMKQILATRKKTTSYWGTYWLTRLIPDLPESVIAPLEELIPTMPDSVADEIIPYLAQRKLDTAKAGTKK